MPGVPWLLASLLLHVWLLSDLAVARQARAASDDEPTTLWMESVAEPAPVVEPREPEVAASPPAQPKPSARPHVKAKQPQPAPPTLPAADGDGSLAVPPGDADSTSTGRDTDGDARGDAAEGGSGTPPPKPVRAREPQPAQLSLWLDIEQLQQLALVRPTTAFLVVVPGYSDMLLGANLRPFSDLARLSIRIASTSAASLTLAGVHNGGEDALRRAAERVAAMRRERPIWRGNSALRATAWVDGSRVDRGLAIHDGAFVIAPRTRMASLLGDRDPSARVAELSKLRARVVLTASIEDVPRYASELDGCGLAALHVSVATLGDEYRLALSASYADDRRAAAARTCTSEHAGETSRLLRSWLADARAPEGQYTTHLNTRVTHAEIERLLDELGWGLRHAQRL